MADASDGAVPASKEEGLSLRQSALWQFIKREKIGNELLFTATHTRQFMQESPDVKTDTIVWDLLRRLEEKGFLKRKKGKHGEGITLLFDEKGPSRNGSRPHSKRGRSKKAGGRARAKATKVTSDGVIAKIDADIAAIEKKLNSLKADLAAKRTLRKQVVQLFEEE